MKKYNWRKNFKATFSTHETKILGNLAFKTEEMNWLETEQPVLVLLSVDSSFHNGIEGDLKMNAFMNTIKNHVKGKITVLLSEMAHLQTQSLKYENNTNKAFEECLKSAQKLEERFKHYFNACHVAYWHSYVSKDTSFSTFFSLVQNLYKTDPVFRDLLHQDAEATYNDKRKENYSNKHLFIKKAIEDILEQCTCLLIIANKGYRFQFYPGKPFASTEYINQTLPTEKQISWINVFLTIEKKTHLKLDFV